MYEWSEEHQMVRTAIRQFVDAEIRPRIDELEHGETPPYDVLRKLFSTFGMDQMAGAGFDARIAREKASTTGEAPAATEPDDESGGQPGRDGALFMIPIIELCRVSPGMVTAMGVSMGLTASAILSKGTTEQKERWARDLLTLEKIGAWAITEPDSGSDAFGGMKATARRDGDEFVINGNKTFITNGPFADTIVYICKLDEGNPPDERKIVSFVLERGMPGLDQPKAFRKMGIHSSPTGELFLDDVRVGIDHLLGGEAALAATGGAAREGAKESFGQERSGVAAMALGIIEESIDMATAYARERTAWGQAIGQYQLIQEKLALMEVARLNVENMVFRALEQQSAGKPLTLAQASAMKLYSARAACEVVDHAVQVFGGNGYMAEFRIEQLYRDARILRIYAGTDEIQITHIARAMLAG